MSSVSYNSKRLIPAPFLTISKNYQKSGNGDIIGKTYSITVTGTIVAYMGSPDSSGTFWDQSGYPDDEEVDADARLGAVLRKQEAIRTLFSQEGQNFEAQSADGSTSLRCYPRILSINFAEGNWYNRCEYTIELEADVVYGLYHEEDTGDDDFDQYISDASEEWTIDTNDERFTANGDVTYALSHTVSAVGKKFYDTAGNQPMLPWQYARNFVLSRLGFDAEIALSSGVNNLPSYYNGVNHVRSEQVDEQGGSFSVTENWLLASGTAIEDFTIRTSSSTEEPYSSVIIEGSVRGFDEKGSDLGVVSNKWDNALAKYAWVTSVALTRAQSYSGTTLNVTPLNESVARNPYQGTIDYTYEYNTRPSNLIENAKSESITIQDNVGGNMFASVFVLGRAAGPVLQDLGTKQANTRSLNIEIVVDPPTYDDNSVDSMKTVLVTNQPRSVGTNYVDDLNNLIDAADPSNHGFTTVFQDQPQESWDIKTGRYSYSCTWTYE